MLANEEENPPVPNWLLKLEEQRERRLKARLGHEAGAGAKCQKCADKCPGLDLHFWRKICKACKCGKEDHDIVDDDIYGFVQFQLLGNKPVKPKGIFLKGRTDELILDWTPRGSANDVGRYLSELPADQLPVRGSAAAKLRKQRLQRQLPAHDIDASLCHQLTEEEVNELQEYVSHIRNNCVGQGKIIRLSLFKGHQHKLTPSNPQFLSQIPPTQLASSQIVSLQSSDLANNLQNLAIRDSKHPQGDKPQKPPLAIYKPPNHECVMDNRNLPMGKAKDVHYSGQQNVVHPLTTSNVERHQEQFENYPEFIPNYLSPVDSHQIPTQVGQPKDVTYPTSEQLPPINNFTHPLMQKDLNYSTINNTKVPLQQYNPNFVNPLENTVLPTPVGQPKDLKYPSNTQNPTNANIPMDHNVYPSQTGDIRDVNYPISQLGPLGDSKLGPNSKYIDPKTGLLTQNPVNANIPLDQNVYPAQIGAIRDQTYPNSQFGPLSGSQIGGDPKLGLHGQNPVNANIPLDHNVYPAQIGASCDQTYPNSQLGPLSGSQIGGDPKLGLLGQNPVNANIPLDQNVYPAQIGANRDQTYPNSQLGPLPGSQIGGDPKLGLLGQNPVNANIPLDKNVYPAQIGAIRDQTYPNSQLGPLPGSQIGGDPKLGLLGQNPVNANIHLDQNVYPAQIGAIRDHTYPNSQLGQTGSLPGPLGSLIGPNSKYADPKLGLLGQNPVNANIPLDQNVYPAQIGSVPKSKYTDPKSGLLGLNPVNVNIPYDQNVYPAQIGAIRDQSYPNSQLGPSGALPGPVGSQSGPNSKYTDPKLGLLGQNPVNANIPLDQNVYPSQIGAIRDQTYPNSGDTNFEALSGPDSSQIGEQFRNKPNIPIFEAQNAINPFETHQNLQSVGYLRDIEHPMQKVSPNVPKGTEIPSPGDQNSNQTNQTIPKCHACKEFFEDGSVAIAVDRTTNMWHSKCFSCHKCQQPLADLVYFYHKDTDNIYCGRDYAELKGIPRCQACDELIFVKEYCLAEDKTFHIKHFCCFECDEPLAGKQYILENNQPVCIVCYESLKAEKCNDCGQTIKPDEQGVSLNNLHWHAVPECFACKKCRKSLFGSKMLLRNNHLFCSDLCFKSF